MTDEHENQAEFHEKKGANLRPFFEGPLTKKVLMSLPEGLLLQSNVCINPMTPKFEGKLGPVESREALWLHLRGLHVDGRMFRGYSSPESYDREFLARLTSLAPKDLDTSPLSRMANEGE